MANIGYVDLEYADEYVSLHFLSTDDLRLSWEGLSDEDKEVLLRRSVEAIETLRFSGSKTSPGQPYSFPRFPSTEIPEAIKAAQVENAISLSDSDTTEDATFYSKLWQWGVESYTIGNLSESVSSGAWGRGSVAANGIVSTKASSLLQPFISGSYVIKGGRT